MVEQLFGSKTRVKLLHLFYSNPNRSFYVREITRKIDEQINSVRRELSNLLSIGIITSDTNHNRLYYEVNQNYQFYHPLTVIFGGRSSTNVATATTAKAPVKAAGGADQQLVKDIRSIGKVDLAILTGQFTRDESMSADLVVVGDINQVQAKKFVEQFEEQEGKEIRYVIMTAPEYQYRLQVNDRFVSQILAAKKQVLINDIDIQVNL